MRTSAIGTWRRAWRLLRESYYCRFPDFTLLQLMERRPPGLTIETCNICNANCVFCAYQYQKRRRQVMSDDTFKKAIRQFVDLGGGGLGLTPMLGDPLLDPRFMERVSYARSFSEVTGVATTTNCLNLHRVGARNLLTSGVGWICVSTTGFSEEMYKRVFRSNGYPRMKENLLTLLRMNHDLGKPVTIEVSLRIDLPSEEVLNYRGFAEVVELADKVDANMYFDSWNGRIRAESLPGNMKLRPGFLFRKRRNPCSMLYGGLGVLVDGTVTLCPCRDADGDSELVVGNLREGQLIHMYNSDHVHRLRDDWMRVNRIPAICRGCTHYRPFGYAMLKEVKTRIVSGSVA